MPPTLPVTERDSTTSTPSSEPMELEVCKEVTVQTTSSVSVEAETDAESRVTAERTVDMSVRRTMTPPAPRPETMLLNLKKIRWQLGILCTLAVLTVLYFARDIFIPIALSITIGLLLRPIVRWMYRRHIPEAVGAIICLLAFVIMIAAVILPILGPARAWMDDMPRNIKRAREKMAVLRDRVAPLLRVQSQIADLAAGGEGEEQTASEKPVPVTVQDSQFTSNALSTTGSMVGMWLVVIILAFFMLIEGDSLINDLLTMLPTFREKRRTVELIKEIERSVSSYLSTITLINVGLGIVITLTLWAMGVPNPAVWGLMTTIFNYVPFIGQGVAGIVIGFVALLSFDSIGYALLVPIVFFSIAAVEGNVITPSLLGRNMSLNPILVLISLIWWGWMWGIAGAALAVPILAVLKISCEHFGVTTNQNATVTPTPV